MNPDIEQIPVGLIGRVDSFSRRWLSHRLDHITLRYIRDRAANWFYERRNPDLPWLTPTAVELLGDLLKKTDAGLEYGSGRSTAWFAAKTRHLTSVESSEEWFERVKCRLAQENLSNVDYRYVPADRAGTDREARAAYVMVDAALKPASLDYALVDGLFRAECALRASELLKPGGVLIVDNANWFLPHPTRSPDAMRWASSAWDEFAAKVADWRMMWTSSGVSDTAIWIKALRKIDVEGHELAVLDGARRDAAGESAGAAR